jgi:hypothetical protein
LSPILVRPSACLPVCLSACLSICLSARPSVCLSACSPVRSVCLSTSFTQGRYPTQWGLEGLSSMSPRLLLSPSFRQHRSKCRYRPPSGSEVILPTIPVRLFACSSVRSSARIVCFARLSARLSACGICLSRLSAPSVYVCLYACLSACLPSAPLCLSVCLYVCLSVRCLSVCLPACALSVCLSVRLCSSACLPASAFVQRRCNQPLKWLPNA